ncbi:tetratricopeptide repeat protein [Deinococcus sp. QL22]|uniref:tetratricopeptide repeat protein n=1 Tax=Deinococcus sp. QL22 TaxID=2939437 RepID=UPI002017527D|nr:tetratricopeptide repeat protein [Deinococcus sp. QL22]UQN05062.1 tetratricopeptide repeat protein [Deinococcus sp. QL22]
MDALPAPLLRALNETRLGVVAPVDVGAGQAALRAWAHARGWTVLDTLPGPGDREWLWCPASRKALGDLRPEHQDALFVRPGDLLPAPEAWDVLPDTPDSWREAVITAYGDWPSALSVVQRLRTPEAGLALPSVDELPRDPQVRVLLSPDWPPADLTSSAARLATSALVNPAVAAALEVDLVDLDRLADGGWLWPVPGGWTFPELLRRALCPVPDPVVAGQAAQVLNSAGHEAAALNTLAGAGAWAQHLQVLAQNARAGQGETSLRARLARVPVAWRQAPAALYLAGLLARSSGDLDEAEALYTHALEGLEAGLLATAHNARGVVRAMRGQIGAALADFEVATGSLGVTAGEANQNRALLLIQTGRHAEAERSLGQAVAAFRAAGDTPREVRSLETLGGLQFGRGLLQEALVPYGKALELQSSSPQDAAMTHLNLAEVYAALGDFGRTETHIQAARSLLGDGERGDAGGWIRRVEALLALHRGQPAQALLWLEKITTQDQTLRAEAALLQARAHRELDQGPQAEVALNQARQLGLRADLEAALQGQGELDGVIAAARDEEARLELATALLHRGTSEDLTKALQLIRTQGYLPLLGSRAAHRLVEVARDPETRTLFPLRVQALGPLRVQHAGRTWHLADFPTRKSAALLMALALSERPQSREALADRFWPGAKNPLASLQTAVYHLRSTFGTALVSTERGQLSLLFPVHSDLLDLRTALQQLDAARLAALLRPLTAPLSAFPDLPSELPEEREQAERLLHDALRTHAAAQPEGDVRRRDALRTLITADPLDLDSRQHLIRWHEGQGELEAADQERRHLEQARQILEDG